MEHFANRSIQSHQRSPCNDIVADVEFFYLGDVGYELDEAAAENELLRLVLSDPAVKVGEFGRQKYKLEDAFLKIVEGDKNGK